MPRACACRYSALLRRIRPWQKEFLREGVSPTPRTRRPAHAASPRSSGIWNPPTPMVASASARRRRLRQDRGRPSAPSMNVHFGRQTGGHSWCRIDRFLAQAEHYLTAVRALRVVPVTIDVLSRGGIPHGAKQQKKTLYDLFPLGKDFGSSSSARTSSCKNRCSSRSRPADHRTR